MALPTAETDYPPIAGTSVAEWPIQRFWSRQDVAKFVPQEIADTPLAQAEVNRGRWIVCCPLIDPSTGVRCGGAQMAADSDPRYFCLTCLNEAVGRKWLTVTWPDAETRSGIEDVLSQRPGSFFQNWLPSETVADLIAENAENMSQ
jgi:hypothetical protein